MCEATSDLATTLRYEAMREMWRHGNYRGESNWSTQEKELSIKIDELNCIYVYISQILIYLYPYM